MSNLQTPRAKTLTNAVRKFLESHGRGTVRFKVTELNGALAVEQIGGKTGDCVDRGEHEFVFRTPKRVPLSVPPPRRSRRRRRRLNRIQALAT